MRVVRLREARRGRLGDIASEYGVEPRLLAGILAGLARLEARAAEALEELGLAAREARPARVERRGSGTLVYTGDWVGVAALRLRGGVYEVVVEPKWGRLYASLSEALAGLEELGLGGLYARVSSALASAGALSHPGVLLAALYAESVAETLPATPEADATIAWMVYAVASAASRLLGLGAPPHAARLAASAVEALALHPRVSRALADPGAADPEPEPVVEAALLARTVAVEGAGAAALSLLLPSPKAFELIALAGVAEALHSLGCRVESLEGWVVHLRCPWGETRIHYNRAPRSKLVEALCGERPHPDIVVEAPHATVIVEAKYRLSRRLTLGDAVRIAAYLHDIDPDALIVAYPAGDTRRPAPRVIEAGVDQLPALVGEALRGREPR